MVRLFLCMSVCLFLACGVKTTESKNPLQIALQSKSPEIKKVINDAEAYEVQILLSTIHREGDSISFTDYSYRLNSDEYFYPASTVKFPIAVLALEKSNLIQDINSNTPYKLLGDSTLHTIRDDVEKIFAVSDNEAYNRLYEFLGRDYINTSLSSKGLGPLKISHRLSVPNADKPNTATINFLNEEEIIYANENKKDKEITPLQLKRIVKGQGYYKESELISEPMDFSKKNYLPLSSLHQLMKLVIFPENYDENRHFKLSSDDRDFLLKAMSIKPREAGYAEENYPDGYVKFFMFGDSEERIPDHIKIYNKVGYAYGYLTDCAYIRDDLNHIEFILTATVHVNKNGIFNDDHYEYDTVGIPFLAELGKKIHHQLIINETN